MSNTVNRYYSFPSLANARGALSGLVVGAEGSYCVRIYQRTDQGFAIEETWQTGERLSQARASGRQSIALAGLGSAAGSVLATVLFHPMLASAGLELFSVLIFIGTMIGAWAGGVFMAEREPLDWTVLANRVPENAVLLSLEFDANLASFVDAMFVEIEVATRVELVNQVRPESDDETESTQEADLVAGSQADRASNAGAALKEEPVANDSELKDSTTPERPKPHLIDATAGAKTSGDSAEKKAG